MPVSPRKTTALGSSNGKRYLIRKKWVALSTPAPHRQSEGSDGSLEFVALWQASFETGRARKALRRHYLPKWQKQGMATWRDDRWWIQRRAFQDIVRPSSNPKTYRQVAPGKSAPVNASPLSPEITDVDAERILERMLQNVETTARKGYVRRDEITIAQAAEVITTGIRNRRRLTDHMGRHQAENVEMADQLRKILDKISN
jgi:hypothetical protein